MLTEKDVYEVLKHIADSDEKCANDVMYALTLLNTNINNMLESVKSQMLDVIANNNFDEIDKLKIFCNNIIELHNQVDNSINALVESSFNAQKATEIISNEPKFEGRKTDYKPPIDYSYYTVNSSEAHLLNEDFENKKICGFNFTGRYCSSDSWQDTLIKLCNELYKKDSIKFSKMLFNDSFKGKKHYYFTKEPLYSKEKVLRNTKLKNTDIYVHTNLSANATVAFIKKILKYFNISLNNCVVYLRADYSPLHNTGESNNA